MVDINKEIENFAPVGTKDCQAMCDRMPIRTTDGIKIVCFGCKRIVMERKDEKKE